MADPKSLETAFDNVVQPVLKGDPIPEPASKALFQASLQAEQSAFAYRKNCVSGLGPGHADSINCDALFGNFTITDFANHAGSGITLRRKLPNGITEAITLSQPGQNPNDYDDTAGETFNSSKFKDRFAKDLNSTTITVSLEGQVIRRP